MATTTTAATVTKKGINNNSKGVSRCVSMLSVLTWPLSGRSGVDLLCALLTAQHTHVRECKANTRIQWRSLYFCQGDLCKNM